MAAEQAGKALGVMMSKPRLETLTVTGATTLASVSATTSVTTPAVTAPAVSSGAGTALTVTSGSGVGGTAAGGNINLVPGAAVSTGTPGEVVVNGVAGITEVNWFQPLSSTACPASAAVGNIFIANRAYRIKGVRASLVLQGTSVTVNITKESGTTAPGAGTTILTGNMSLAVSNTVVTGTLVSTVATLLMAAGDRLSFTIGGTVGAATGLTMTVLLVPA